MIESGLRGGVDADLRHDALGQRARDIDDCPLVLMSSGIDSRVIARGANKVILKTHSASERSPET